MRADLDVVEEAHCITVTWNSHRSFAAQGSLVPGSSRDEGGDDVGEFVRSSDVRAMAGTDLNDIRAQALTSFPSGPIGSDSPVLGADDVGRGNL